MRVCSPGVLWPMLLATLVGCMPTWTQKIVTPPLVPAPKQAVVTFLGARIDRCLGGCGIYEEAIQRGLAQGLKDELGWSLRQDTATASQPAVEFQGGQACLLKTRAPEGWTIAARLMSTSEESRGEWISDLILGAKKLSAAVQITLWNPRRELVLDHLVFMSWDADAAGGGVSVTPRLPLRNGLDRVGFAPNIRGTPVGLAEEAARTAVSALSLALKPETSSLTLVFAEKDERAKGAVELAGHGRLAEALAALQAIRPTSASVEHNLGMVQLGLGHEAEALSHFEAAHGGGMRTYFSAVYLNQLREQRDYARRPLRSDCGGGPESVARR